MPDAILISELKDGVLTLSINRPKANAFNDELIAELQSAFKEARRNKDVRCVLLAAKGKLFSAGQDLGALGGGGEELSFLKHLRKNYNPLIKQIRRLEKPVIAAINGATAGAALGVVLACDLRIASEDARFVVGFGGIGLAPDSAVSLMLPALIGLGRAAQATFFNEPISAQDALDWGMVNALVPGEKLTEVANQWAQKLAQGPIKAMGITKRDFNKAILPHLDQVLEYEAQNQEIAGRGKEHKEGVSAFLEKRLPNYVEA